MKHHSAPILLWIKFEWLSTRHFCNQLWNRSYHSWTMSSLSIIPQFWKCMLNLKMAGSCCTSKLNTATKRRSLYSRHYKLCSLSNEPFKYFRPFHVPKDCFLRPVFLWTIEHAAKYMVLQLCNCCTEFTSPTSLDECFTEWLLGPSLKFIGVHQLRTAPQILASLIHKSIQKENDDSSSQDDNEAFSIPEPVHQVTDGTWRRHKVPKPRLGYLHQLAQ